MRLATRQTLYVTLQRIGRSLNFICFPLAAGH